MITFACFLWKSPNKIREFKAEYVNALYRGINENYRKPFRFVCITDMPAGLLPEIETLPLPQMDDIPSPHGDTYPSCYRRLWLFSQEAAEVLPGQVVCIDVDAVICGDITDFFDRPEDCVMWHDTTNRRLKYSGGLWMIRTGTRTHVWDTFDPVKSPEITKKAGWFGSDQAWMSYCLDGEASWGREQGLYRTRDLVQGSSPLIAQTPSQYKPWTESFRVQYPHLYKHWQRHYQPKPEPKLEEPTEVARYKLLKSSTIGRAGEIVEVSPNSVQALRANGIIGEAYREPEIAKVIEPEVKKVVTPTVTKRTKRASKATN